jgi:outer membrane protein assembly factor BamB
VSGEFTLAIDNVSGQTSAVFCQEGNGPLTKTQVTDDQVNGNLTGNSGITCQWYLLTVAAAPTATATATAVPTKAAESPTATAAPSATARVTATPAGTEEGPAATPGELPPPPGSDDPPTMFRANPNRTGEQPGPEPAGDPAMLWRYPVSNRPVSSPVLAGDTLYIGGDDGLLAIYAETGTVRWLYPTQWPVLATPAVVEGLAYVGSQDGLFVCVDARTGLERWRLETAGMILSSPLVLDGVVYFTSYDGFLYALDANSGEQRWRARVDGSEYIPSPAYWEGVVIVATGDVDGGFLYGLDVDSGKELWRHQVAGSIGSTPTVVDGVAYFGSDDGYFYAFDTISQERVFRLNTGKLIRSSAAVFGGRAYIGNRLGILYAFDAKSGELAWQFDSGDWIDSPPSFVGDRIYVGTKHRRLLVLNSADGSIIWEYNIRSSITTAPVVENEIVYVAARDGFLYAIGGTESAGESEESTFDIARPVNVPKEVIVDDARYLFDQMVEPNIDELDRIHQIGTMTIYQRPQPSTSDAVYVQIEDRLEEGEQADPKLARYLPENINVEGAECLSEAPREAAVISTGNDDYIFAGADPDVTVDSLEEVASTQQLGSVYAESKEPPIRELFTVSSDVTQRYVLLNEDGLPEQLRGTVPFGGRIYRFSDVDSEIDPQSLVKIGCAGPFPMQSAAASGDNLPDRLYAVINDQVLAFDEVESESDGSSSSPDATPEALAPRPILMTVGRNELGE